MYKLIMNCLLLLNFICVAYTMIDPGSASGSQVSTIAHRTANSDDTFTLNSDDTGGSSEDDTFTLNSSNSSDPLSIDSADNNNPGFVESIVMDEVTNLVTLHINYRVNNNTYYCSITDTRVTMLQVFTQIAQLINTAYNQNQLPNTIAMGTNSVLIDVIKNVMSNLNALQSISPAHAANIRAQLFVLLHLVHFPARPALS